MKKLIKRIAISALFFIVFAEIVSRVLHLSTDAPRMYQTANGIVKYYPNQGGYWEGAKHKWFINELGFPGKNLPESYDNLVTIVGPSIVANFMNPDSCRQMEFLRIMNPSNNYLELSRPGLNILEAFELIEDIDSLNPKINLIYALDKSFVKSIKKKSSSSGFQLNVDSGEVSISKYKESSFKRILYNFKFAYYLYRKNLHIFQKNNLLNLFKIKQTNKKRALDKAFSSEELGNIDKLLDYIKNNYKTENTAFVFSDRNSRQIFDLAISKGFKAMRFDSGNNDWTLKNDTHWSCYGHHEAARQVNHFLERFYTIF